MLLLNQSMSSLEFFYKMLDSVPKLIFRVREIFFGVRVFSSNSKSDSDSTSYGSFVDKALNSKRYFKRFRRNYSYRVILEHVGYKLGKAYLDKINESTIEFYLQSVKLRNLSIVGSPRRFYYKKLGWISPTVLRYLYVNQHLDELFGDQQINKYGEIGIGFGGQLAIILEKNAIESYSIYDLEQVARLSQKVLSDVGIDTSRVLEQSIAPLKSAAFDLVISNYAFSELPHSVELEYARVILAKSKRGYLTMNSGRTNHSGRSDGKMTLSELTSIIPGCEVIEEDPLTGPDNYIIVWGHKK